MTTQLDMGFGPKPIAAFRELDDLAQSKKDVHWFVNQEEEQGKWRKEIIPANVVGLSRDITVYRAARKTNLITYDWHGDKETFCPPLWWDLAIGSGACGLGCRSCFLMLTHRIRRDPLAHLLYDNYAGFESAVGNWLRDPKRRKQHTLGIGIDRSDSLLYEGVTSHVRRLAPFFGDEQLNRKGNKMVLLTKSGNTQYLADIEKKDRQNIVVTFSLNPEPVADLWEGKWPDTGERITPAVSWRMLAAGFAQQLGFEIRVRLDPILTPAGWQDHYREWLAECKKLGLNFRYWTLGTYREKNPALDLWREKWGLPEMEWQPEPGELEQAGTHRHLPAARRIEIYRTVQGLIREEFPEARVSLCKETHDVRKAVAGMCNADCNCLI
jgi:DNA repair photolyase